MSSHLLSPFPQLFQLFYLFPSLFSILSCTYLPTLLFPPFINIVQYCSGFLFSLCPITFQLPSHLLNSSLLFWTLLTPYLFTPLPNPSSPFAILVLTIFDTYPQFFPTVADLTVKQIKQFKTRSLPTTVFGQSGSYIIYIKFPPHAICRPYLYQSVPVCWCKCLAMYMPQQVSARCCFQFTGQQ